MFHLLRYEAHSLETSIARDRSRLRQASVCMHGWMCLPCRAVQADADEPVAIYAEGKEHAMAIGLTKMSTADMKAVNKGIAVGANNCTPHTFIVAVVQNWHCLGG